MDIAEKIKNLKKKKNAVILAHNYQLPEIHKVADFLGDSLGLSIQASRTAADIIVFCGVYFMAETAKILSPSKTVLIPDKRSGCPMADMITADDVRALKRKHPGAKVLCYVNTPAEVKAESDFCCTSANAVKMAKEAFREDEEVIFVPDKNLASYVSGVTKREFIVWEGYCPAHVNILPSEIKAKQEKYPDALVLVHPECAEEIINLADGVLSTEAMCRYAANSPAKEFIIGTETGMIYRLQRENPGKYFYPASESSVCEDMKKITLDKVAASLENMQDEVILPDDVIIRAKDSIYRMLKFID